MKRLAHFYGTVKDGKLVLQCPQLASEFLKSMPEDTPVEMTIRKQYANKTTQQLAYYFACLVKKPSDELGFGVRIDGRFELDMIFRQLFLTQMPGTDEEYVQELSDLTVAEMGDYIENCFRQLVELGYQPEEPDPRWKLKGRNND